MSHPARPDVAVFASRALNVHSVHTPRHHASGAGVQVDSQSDLQNLSHNSSEAGEAAQRALPAQASARTSPSASPLEARPVNTFPPFAFPTSFVPPKPDSNGAAIGIPIPLQALPRSTGGTTLPPMPAPSAANPAALQSAHAAAVEVAPPASAAVNAAAGASPQYRKVFVPSTVVHNGVAQQMLVPMLCIVAPMQPGSLTGGKLAAKPVGMAAALPALHASAQSAAAPASSCGGKVAPRAGKRSRRQAEGLKALGPAYMPLKRVSSQSRYGTRSRALPLRAAEEAATPEQSGSPTAQQGTDALNMLADAALLELC